MSNLLPSSRSLDVPEADLDRWRRYFARRITVTADGCWQFGRRQAGSYATISLSPTDREVLHRTNVTAHKLSYAVHVAPIPYGLVVRHGCDFPTCVNPAHLSLGSQFDNTMDSVTRGRANRARGESAASARLTEEQVRTIRGRTFRYGERTALSRELGVSLTTIRAVLKGDRWRHVA